MAQDITPIFVLGLQRSGTTWTANSLAGHPRIAAIEAADHQGVHESIFFSHFARAYGDPADGRDFARFAEDFTSCDYFLLSGLDAAEFRRDRPASYPAAFSWVMDRVARRKGADHWLEKSPHHTLLADELAAAYPAARFVCVTRRADGLLRSRLVAFGRTRPGPLGRVPVLLRGCLAVALYDKFIAGFVRRCPRALLVRYEDMLADQQGQLERIAGFLGVGFDPVLLEKRYRPNTSFATSGEKDQALGAGDRALIALAMAALRPAPLPWLRRASERAARKRGLDWPDWCWRRRDAGRTNPDDRNRTETEGNPS